MALSWHKNNETPDVGKNIIIEFCNDIGNWYAAGIAVETSDTHEIVFADVLSGTLYDWNNTVIRWSYL